MKKYIIKVFLFFIIFLGGLLLLIAVMPKSEKSTFYLSNLKMELLKKTPSPRIIFISGSSIFMGVNSERIADSLKMNVVNFAHHAGAGLKYIMDDALPYIRKGDIVVISPEYPQFYEKTAYGNSALASILYFNGLRSIETLNTEQWINVISSLPSILNVNVLEMLLPGKTKDQPFAIDRVNRYGDEVAHWKIKTDGSDVVLSASKDSVPFNENFFDYFVKQVKNMQSRGAKVMIVPSVIRETAFKYEKQRAYEIDKRLRENGLSYYSKPEQHVQPDSCAWDTDYHMNAIGVERNTDVLIKDLLEFVKK